VVDVTTLLDFFEDTNIIKNGEVFDLRYVPRHFYIRKEMHRIAENIKMFIKYGIPEHIYLSGKPGSGKTASIKYLQREAEMRGFNLGFYYVSGREYNTKYKIMARICGFERSIDPNKVHDEFFRRVKGKAIIVLDEADLVSPRELNDVCFMFSRWGEAVEVANDSVVLLILIGCNVNLTKSLEPSVFSSLHPKFVFYGSYKKEELFEILRLRAKEGLHDGGWSDEMLEEIAAVCAEEYLGDARFAILALRELAVNSEFRGLDRIEGDIEGAFVKAAENVLIATLSGLGSHELLILYSACRTPEDDRTIGAIRRMYEFACSCAGVKPVKKSKFYEVVHALDRLNVVSTAGKAKAGRGRPLNYVMPLVDEDLTIRYVEGMFDGLRKGLSWG